MTDESYYVEDADSNRRRVFFVREESRHLNDRAREWREAYAAQLRDQLALWVAGVIERYGEGTAADVIGALVDAQVLQAHSDLRCMTHGGHQPNWDCNEGCDYKHVVTHYTH